jgi:hypothetical protein
VEFNPSGSNIVELDPEQAKMCSGTDEVATMMYEQQEERLQTNSSVKLNL